MRAGLNSLLVAAVVTAHMGFVLFVAFGGFLVLQAPWVAAIHLPAALYGVLIEWVGWTCPLTPAEKAFRRRAGMPVYDGDFTERYVLPFLPLPATQQESAVILGGLIVLLNLLAYGLVLSGMS